MGFQELQPSPFMSEMWGMVPKAIRQCYHLYTLVRLIHLCLRFNLKIKHPLPTPFTSLQTTPQHLLHTSASQSYLPSQHTHSVSSSKFPPPLIQYTPSPSPHPTSMCHMPPLGSTMVGDEPANCAFSHFLHFIALSRMRMSDHKNTWHATDDTWLILTYSDAVQSFPHDISIMQSIVWFNRAGSPSHHLIVAKTQDRKVLIKFIQ
jgi:hypothetical protein